MGDTDYFRSSFREMRIEKQPEKDKKGLIVIKGLFDSEKVDYSNPDNLWALSYNARKNANDLYNLVMEKYKGQHPAYIPELEMLVALINLSSELYMKCIIYHYKLNQGKQIKGKHNLESYFLKLPEDVKSDLETIDDDFDAQIKTISNYFNEYRYNFEFNRVFTNLFAFSFAEKLNQICNSLEIKGPPEIICTKNKMLLKQGKDVVWDSSKQHEYPNTKNLERK